MVNLHYQVIWIALITNNYFFFFICFQQHNWNTQAKKRRTETKNDRPCGKHKEKCKTRGRCKSVEIQTEENRDCCSSVFCGIYHIQILDHLKIYSSCCIQVYFFHCTSSTDHGHTNVSEPDFKQFLNDPLLQKRELNSTYTGFFIHVKSHVHLFLHINTSQFRFNFFNY